MEGPAGVGQAGEVGRLADVGRLVRAAVDPGHDEHAPPGQVVDDGRRHARLGRGEGVAVLGLPVDGQQVAVVVGQASDVAALRRRDLQVEVGQTAGQRLDGARPPREPGHLVEAGLDLGGQRLGHVGSWWSTGGAVAGRETT